MGGLTGAADVDEASKLRDEVFTFGGMFNVHADRTEKESVVYCGSGIDGIGLPISVELDEGAKGNGGNWIDPAAVEKFGLKRKAYAGGMRFMSRLFPGDRYCPKEEVELRLVFEPAGVAIALRCLVLPENENNMGAEQSELIIGDADIQYFGVRDLIGAKSPVFKPAVQAREVWESLGEQLREQELLENTFGSFVDVASVGLDKWDPQLDIINFPVGSEGRARVIRVLDAYLGSVLVRTLDGTKAKIPPLMVQLKPGKVFEGVRARRYAPDKQKVLREWMDKMIKAGIIRPSTSTTSSPLLVVCDPSGKMRVTQDVTVLNDMMRTLQGSIPDIKTLLEKFKGKKYLSVVDLIAAYHQLPADERMRKLWAFSTPWGVYEYTDRLPMGDKNICVWFNDQMLKVMDGIPNVAVYFDDLPFGANSVDELVETLIAVFERLKKYNIKVSLEKLRIGYSILDILGFDVSEKGYRPRERNVCKFLSEPFPNTEGLRHWMGLLNVFARFIPNYAEIREPFRHALQKGGSLVDCQETREAFEKAKRAIASIQQLVHLEDGREIWLDTDASDYGIGAVLYHKDEKGQIEPILFSAHLLSDGARKWSTKKKEAYAIYKALEDMSYLLRGREFTLRTDHRNLLYMMNSTDQVEHRFYQFISEFSFNLEHVPGVENVVADPLSRMFTNGNPNMFGGINREMVYEFFSRTHNIDVGHLGINKTVDAVRDVMVRDGAVVPTNLRTEIVELIAECMLCTKARAKKENPVLMPHALHGGRFFERIQMDFLEGLKESADGYVAVLVIVCTFSKFVMLFPTKDKTADVARTCLLYCMSIFGFPALAVSDGGPAFKSEEIQCLADYVGTDTMLTHPHRPSAHGNVERVHQSVMKHLGHLLHQVVEAEEVDWPIYLPWVQRIINNTVNRSTRYAPVSIVFGTRHVNDSRMMEFAPTVDRTATVNYDEWVTRQNDMLSALQTSSNTYLDNAILERVQRMQEAEEDVEMLAVGSYVLVRIPAKSKLQLRWRGPYRVVEVLADNFYKLRDITQDLDVVEHREDLWLTDCKSDEEALEYAQRDTSELTIVEVRGHAGKAEKPSTVMFECLCKGSDNPVKFAFRECKHVGVVKEYIKNIPMLKPLTAAVHYAELRMRKKTKKLTASLRGYK